MRRIDTIPPTFAPPSLSRGRRKTRHMQRHVNFKLPALIAAAPPEAADPCKVYIRSLADATRHVEYTGVCRTRNNRLSAKMPSTMTAASTNPISLKSPTKPFTDSYPPGPERKA